MLQSSRAAENSCSKTSVRRPLSPCADRAVFLSSLHPIRSATPATPALRSRMLLLCHCSGTALLDCNRPATPSCLLLVVHTCSEPHQQDWPSSQMQCPSLARCCCCCKSSKQAHLWLIGFTLASWIGPEPACKALSSLCLACCHAYAYLKAPSEGSNCQSMPPVSHYTAINAACAKRHGRCSKKLPLTVTLSKSMQCIACLDDSHMNHCDHCCRIRGSGSL